MTIRLRLPHFSGLYARTRRIVKILWRLCVVFARRIHIAAPFAFLWRKRRIRVGFAALAGVIVLAQIAALISPFLVEKTYALGNSEQLLSEREPTQAANLVFDAQQKMFSFDSKKTLQNGTATNMGGGVTATAYTDASKGVSVSDKTNNVDFKMSPKFRAADGQKDSNRIIYPLLDHDGWAVYTMTAMGPKEDIVLKSAKDDRASFEYEMNLSEGTEARVEADGSVGIYGNSLFSSNITAGTEKDAALLKKARDNAEKNTRLFVIPAPVIKETGKDTGEVFARYEVNGSSLKVNVENLKKGSYPLTIDPSIYVVTAAQFMYGNNESNINFDVANKLIKKGSTTGARFDSWQTTTNLPSGQFGGATVASGGYIYQVGGANVSGSGTIITTQGSSNYVVPAGITSITIKGWGGGGGAGGSYAGSNGGHGGGGGYTTSTIAVTPGETLNVYIGGGGGGGAICTGFFCGGGNAGGGGGGYTSIYRNSTPLLIAPGGGGGGGGRNQSSAGAPGGAGGGSSGVNGGQVLTFNNGGGGGTQSSGGAAGVGNCPGANGSSLAGGVGGAFSGGCNGGGGGVGGLATGGAGGNAGVDPGGGGGGGSGYYGGGGGSLGVTGSAGNGGGGGGGGSGYVTAGCSVTSCVAGSGRTPGNNADGIRGTSGTGGTAPTGEGAGASGTNGLIFINSSAGNAAANTLNWAQFDPGNGTVVNANPGSGTCGGWCSSPAYNLPVNRTNLSLVAYNGYLYAMGGNDENGSMTLNAKMKTVYVAKLGANGEPRLWHPTDANPDNWGYWYSDPTNMSLPSERIQGAAVAYNNKMYFIGGLDNSTAVGAATTTTWVANILPNGKLGTWATSTALTAGGPGATYGATAVAYNDTIYLLGGAGSAGGAPFATNSYYIKVNADGSLASTWSSTNSFATGRVTGGGTNAVAWGGYLYISGGCSTTNSGNSCTNILSDTQIASINADGSLGSWSVMANVSKQNMGHSLLAWRDNLYMVGGCTAQDGASGSCSTGAQAGISYGAIKQDGEVSTVTGSSANASGTCTGTTPTNCDLPATASVGNILTSSVVSNGYLYVTGGCTNGGCTATSGGTAFTQVTANGDLVRPATCPTGSTATNGWCVMDTTIAGGVAAARAVVFNDTVYLIGGFTGTALTDAVQRATINPTTGILSSWTSSSLSGVGATAVSSTYSFARANPSTASSTPGNLYIIGGCTTSGSGSLCSAYTAAVYKCTISTTGAVADCTTSGQLQLGTATGASGAGIAAAGATFGKYIYLIGGSAPGSAWLNTTRYAAIDASNNIVTTGTGWTESSQTLLTPTQANAAFSYNGYLYTSGGYNGAGNETTNKIQYIKINIDDGSLSTSGWKTSAITTSTGLWGQAITVANGFAYVSGGCTIGTPSGGCSNISSAQQRFKLYNNESGNTTGWASSASQYTTTRWYAASAVLNGYIYIAGGCTAASGNDCSTVSNNVQKAAINSYGAVGAWSATNLAVLPAARGGMKMLVAGGTLYVVGGHTANYASSLGTIYYATPNATGDIASWATASNSLPAGRTQYGAAVWNNRMYILGGLNTACAASTCGTTYISPQLNNGGNITAAWTTSTNTFSVPRIGAGAVAYANNLYLLGGKNGNGAAQFLNDVQYTKIDTTTGALSTWSPSESMPAAVWQPEVFASNGYLYVVGGYRNGTSCATSTMISTISSNTSITNGNNPTGTANWYESRAALTGGRYGSTGQYYNGKLYILGGFCPNAGVSPNVQQTSVLVQPQIAKYSLAFDTDTNVYPSSFLINGRDNSIGSRWQLKYRSMSDPGAVTNLGTGVDCSSTPMSDWGQETNAGALTLGSIGTYTPKDTSGANMACGRYFTVNLTVDAQSSFGFPEDTARGPTITDVSLRYTAAPSKRSLHGRSFINGIQTPLDTPAYAN